MLFFQEQQGCESCNYLDETDLRSSCIRAFQGKHREVSLLSLTGIYERSPECQGYFRLRHFLRHLRRRPCQEEYGDV